MIVVCITGLFGSGKDTVADYLVEKHGFHKIDMGEVLREMLKEKGIKPTRENLQEFRKQHGNTFLAEEITKRIEKGGWKRVVINGVRRSEDYEIPKKKFGEKLKMILIKADKIKRFIRLKRRGSERDPKSIKEFEKQERREYKIYDFNKTFSYADFVVENNSTIEDLKSKIDKIVGELL